MNGMYAALILAQQLWASEVVWPSLESAPPLPSRLPALKGVRDDNGRAIPAPNPRLDVALIVSIDDYTHLPDIPNARKNGRDWYRYFNTSRGISPDRILWLDDTAATRTEILQAADSIRDLSIDGGNLWFVFIGHGAPSVDGPKLVGVNTESSYSQMNANGITLVSMMDILTSGRQSHTISVIDASFSGKGYSGKPLVSDQLPQISQMDFPYVTNATFFMSGSFEDSAGLLPGSMRPAFSYLLLGALHGWADEDKDGQVRAQEGVNYARRALRATTASAQPQRPELIGSGELLVAPALSRTGPNLAVIREKINPMVMSRSQWDVKVDRGGGARKNYAKLAKAVESKAAIRLNNAAQERARKALLDDKVRQLQREASQAWNVMSKARSMGGNEIYRLVESFIADYSSAEVHVDGLKAKVTIPQVQVAKTWLKEHGRFLTGALGYDMVLHHGGEFTMGSSESETGRDSDEKQHKVTLNHDFYIGRAEVTQSLWREVMFDNPSHFNECGNNCPVDSISWCDAIIFSNRMSQREGYEPAYQVPDGFDINMDSKQCDRLSRNVSLSMASTGYRLPTEAEWEYAARHGYDGVYSGSNALDSIAWYEVNSRFHPHPVRKKEPNSLGLYDMSGNVWELVWNGYAAYPQQADPVVDPTGPLRSALKVIRGGSWGLEPKMLRVANRYHVNPGAKIRDVGLRLVRTVQ